MAFVVRKPGEKKKQEKRGYSAVLYGRPLIGKTTSLGLDPNFRVCLIDLDKNSTVVEEAPNVTIIGCDTYEDYLAVKEGVRSGVFKYPGGELKMDFDLYAIDSFTTLEEKIKWYVVNVYASGRRREIASKFGAQSDWQDLQDHEIQEVRDWQTMTKRPDNPVNVLWIGHDMTLTDDLTGQATLAQIALQGKYASPRIMSAVDAVFYMFKMPDPKQEGVVHRGIYTQQQGIYQAEARVSIARRKELPPVIWNPKWSEVYKIMGYEK